MQDAAGNDHPPRTRAIVLIPGWRREEKGFRRNVLTDNLAAVVQTRRLVPAPEAAIAGESGQSLAALPLRHDDSQHQSDSSPDRIDIFEAFWADMIPSVGESGPWKKLINGLDLLIYWMCNRNIWGALRISPAISLGLIAGGLLMVLWYVSIVLIVVEAIAQTGLPKDLQNIQLAKDIFSAIKSIADHVYGLEIWAVTAAFLAFIKADEVVGLSRFIQEYFENRIISADEDTRQVGLKDRLRERIIATLERVMAGPYDDVIIVAHSFGTVIAVDALREWPHDADFNRLKLVTLGSPLAVMSHRSPWLKGELDALLAEGRLKSWDDYHSGTDWLCSPVPGHANTFSGHSHALDFEAPFRERITGRTHLLYYRDQTVLTALAET